MSSFEILDMTEAHHGQATDIWTAGWTQGHAAVVPAELIALRTAESFRIRLTSHIPNTRVIIKEAEVIGLCIIKDAEVYQMYVGKSAQGTGAAQALMADAVTRIAEAGHQTAWLDCAVGNARAARFYEKSGWTNRGTKLVALETLDDPFELEIWRYEKSVG